MSILVYPTNKSTPTLDQHYMPALTGIRAIAAYMVCFFHYNPLVRFQSSTDWKRLGYSFFNELHVGVTVFFILSGFLICYRYYEGVVHITRPWFGRYMMNRVARIYPMYLLGTLLTFALIEVNPVRYELFHNVYSSLATNGRLAVVALNLTLLKGFFNDFKFTGLAQAWSLTVEECFYLGAPFFMLAIRRSRWFLVLLPVATLVLLALLWQLGRQLDFYGLFGSLRFMLNFTFFGRCLEFFAGMALAVFLRQQRQYSPTALTRKGGWLTLLGVASLLGCILAMASIKPQPIIDLLDYNYNSKDSLIGIAINNIALPLAVTLLFYGLLTELTWLRSLLSTKLFDTLGKSSYIFYLIHTGVINILLRTYVAHNAVLQFVLLNAISVLLYKFVETPLHTWLRPRQAPTTAA